jgi:hypothetical protein
MYVVQSIKSGKHTSFIKQSQNEYNVAKVALDDNKKKLLGLIGDVYGHNYAHMVSMGSLWEGMPMNLLMLAKGKARILKLEQIRTQKVTMTDILSRRPDVLKWWMEIQ